MTAALYNQDNRFGIPACVWPAVLGGSVALHVAIVVYGLPSLSWQTEERPEPIETEVILEEGGSLFESLTAAVPDSAEAATAETAVIAPVATQPELAVASVEPVQPDANDIQSLQPVVADPGEPVAAASPAPQTVVPVSPAAEDIDRAETVVPETATVTPLSSVAPVEVHVPEAPAAAGGPAVEPLTDVVEAGPEDVPQAQVESLVPVASSNVVSGTVASGVAQQGITPVEVVPAPAAADLATAAPVEAVRPVSGVSPVALNPPTQQHSEPVATSVPDGSAVPQDEPVPVPEIQTVTSAEVEDVQAAEQEIVSIDPAQSLSPVVSPTQPETSAIAPAVPAASPAGNVPAQQVASIDPLEQVSAYVAGYNAGDCTHLSVTAAGADSASVTAFGAGIAPFLGFDRKFAEDHGYDAKIEVNLISTSQCAVIDALGLANGVEAPGLIDLDATVVPSGARVAGVIQRDLPLARIATAEGAGIALGGKGPPELYLVDDAGQIHDGRRYLLPASNAVTAGGWRFEVPVTSKSGAETETALVVAIWNRPGENRPPSFGTLPSARIVDVLGKPGVFSVAAFKVSR